MPEDSTEDATVRVDAHAIQLHDPALALRARVIEGPDQDRVGESDVDRFTIGTHESNLLALTDGAVSRFHCELVAVDNRVLVRDLDSKNGTFLDGVPVREAWARNLSTLRLGRTTLELTVDEARRGGPLSELTELGGLVGRSVVMRRLFARLERVAEVNSTVLLTGETGTGKSTAARAIHERSPRADGPFVVVDCAALGASLVDSDLFGHERGSFTGADRERVGAFEAANGGTLFLDEVGELSLELQKKLLRVLERRAVRRVGADAEVSVDVRVIAATHRDLRRAVNRGEFREDLYYRLAVLPLHLPPLRERLSDLPILATRIAAELGATSELSEEIAARLVSTSWPGNVRQLANYLERWITLGEPSDPSVEAEIQPTVDPRMPLARARRQVVAAFERRYLRALLELCEGNVTETARRAGLSRTHMHAMLRRHAIDWRGDE